MKLYLASFLEPDNFGPGRVIGIANGEKPLSVEVESKFEPLIPPEELLKKYYNMAAKNPTKASDMFVSEFKKQLEEFASKVMTVADSQNKSPSDILPFKEGDTLASWERKDNTNYRKIVAPVLTKLGFDVVLN